MEDPEIRRKYHKCKYVVKMWEKSFKKKHDRIPSKYDIQDASRKIRDAYKLYFHLKMSRSEDTLSQVFSEDALDMHLEISQDATNISQGATNISQDATNISQDTQTILDTTQSQHDWADEINKEALKAWGDEVSNKKAVPHVDEKKITPPKIAPKSKLNAKLFATSSFSKRNPRKSLSRTTSMPSRTISNLSLSSDCDRQALPDLETILIEKSQKAKESTTVSGGAKPNTLRNSLDRGWLSRHLSDSSLVGMTESQPLNENQQFGLSNVNPEVCRQFSTPEILPSSFDIVSPVSETKPIPKIDNDDSDSVVSNSEDESSKRRFECRPALKRRKVEIEVKNSQNLEMQSIVTAVATENPRKQEDASKKTKTNISSRKLNKQSKKTAEVSTDYSDEDYSEPKPRRKKAVANKPQRTKAKKSETANTRKKTGASKKMPARSVKSKTASAEPPPEIEASETPEDYYKCILDTRTVRSLPRFNVNELDDAGKVVDSYISNSTKYDSTKSSKSQLKEISLETNLSEKLASGRANENFVRINIKKKVFVRGKKSINYSKYKKGLWKQKKAAALCGPDMDMRGCGGGLLTCFKCGQPGHFAQRCPVKGDSLLPIDSATVDESPFPTLQEAEEMASRQAKTVHSRNIANLPKASNDLLYKDYESESEKENVEMEPVESAVESLKSITKSDEPKTTTFIGHKIPEDFLAKAGLLDGQDSDRCYPLYDLQPNGEVIETPAEVYDALKLFGHAGFRKGQDKAIMRILSGVSTLVTLSTGSGKSLCYQLPAYLYGKKRRCITLVISPLVSLMEDQVHGVPFFLNAQCLHTNQTPVQRQKVMDMINSGQVDVLLVSPEAIVAGERSTGFGSILRSLPPIAFACIDEVHCVSQWSHNFRPSYLMICKVLKTKLGVRTILGLTATATFQTRESIIQHLNIPDGLTGIIADIPLPDNLILSVSKDENRDNALVELLRSSRFSECQSIIVYCTRRDQCERVAGFIRTYLQDIKSSNPNTGKRKRVNWQAEPYHAGMPAYRRRTIQKAFMQNELRIVVATVAFGMGINKPDIRAIIHYNMPKTFESYVQEVGRAGRDGLPAHCHLFLDSKGADQNELRRHIYANSIDRHVIRKLLQQVFVACSCSRNITKKEFVDAYSDEIQAAQNMDWDEDFFTESAKPAKRICPGHEIGIPVEKTVQTLDIPEENVSTLLCYLELDGRWSLKTLSNAYVMCKIISYGGPAHIKKAAKDCPPLAMAIALEIKKGSFNDSSNVLEFSVIEIASAIGWNSGIVKYQLKNLEWTTVDGFPKRSTITVNFYELGFRIQSPGDFTDDELDEALDVLFNRSVRQEKAQLIQLQQVFEGLSSVAYKSFLQCSSKDWSSENCDSLKTIVRDYFKRDLSLDEEPKIEVDKSHDNQIICDVQSMINMYPENNFTGRSLARIFHGIQSPNYPALMWSRCKYWRAHFAIDFNHLVRLANAVIIEMRK